MRDAWKDAPPPSSRRGQRRGYRFEVEAALIRNFRMTPERATDLVRRWRLLVDQRSREGRSALSTAEHVERFDRQRLVSPYPSSRDAGARPRRGTKPTARQRAYIQRKIPILRREGYPPDQAVAIAYRMAGVPPRPAKRKRRR